MTMAMLAWLIALPLLGVLTGLRTMTPMAVLCWFAYRGNLPVDDTWASWDWPSGHCRDLYGVGGWGTSGRQDALDPKSHGAGSAGRPRGVRGTGGGDHCNSSVWGHLRRDSAGGRRCAAGGLWGIPGAKRAGATGGVEGLVGGCGGGWDYDSLGSAGYGRGDRVVIGQPFDQGIH